MPTKKKSAKKKVSRPALVSQGRTASTLSGGQIAHNSGLIAAREGQSRKSPYNDVERDQVWLAAYDSIKSGHAV